MKQGGSLDLMSCLNPAGLNLPALYTHKPSRLQSHQTLSSRMQTSKAPLQKNDHLVESRDASLNDIDQDPFEELCDKRNTFERETLIPKPLQALNPKPKPESPILNQQSSC